MKKDIYHFEIGNGTDVGRVRSANEDNFVCHIPAKRRQKAAKGCLLVVCDGMGGALGGQIASRMAVEVISEVYYMHSSKDPSAALQAAIIEANRHIFDRSRNEQELRGMGTTAVAVALFGDKMHLAHVGDSRCYLVREGTIRQLTEDHTLVQKMVNDGLITDEEARKHPESHILSRSVGVGPEVEVDVLQPPQELHSGDKLVLCSDGLSGLVEDQEILAAATAAAPQEAIQQLIALANERGGTDNITVQVVSVEAGKSNIKKADGATVTRSPGRKPKKLKFLLIFLLVLALIAAGIYFSWLWEIIDFRELLNLDWIPQPPKSLPPFK